MIDLSREKNQIQYVSNFQELALKPFQGNINAICWDREHIGDFSEIVSKIEFDGNMTIVQLEELHAVDLSQEGKLAREILLTDFKKLEDHGGSPILNVIQSYERDDSYPFFPTDVYSFHLDRSPVPTDTFLCSYHGESSEILPNSDAQQKILIPEIRNELKKLYDGPKDGFDSFLSEYFFDLHYQAKPEAKIIKLGLSKMWKLAVDQPNSSVSPCIHRAPKEKSGEKRLLMIC